MKQHNVLLTVCVLSMFSIPLWGNAFTEHECGVIGKIFGNFFSFQATEMVLTSKWGRIQPERPKTREKMHAYRTEISSTVDCAIMQDGDMGPSLDIDTFQNMKLWYLFRIVSQCTGCNY